jgi:serine/threonine protein kinase
MLGRMFADRYELGAPLGRGGMAEVFEAVAHGAHGFERRVAIKRLLPEIGADVDLVRRFLDEARIASHLHHAGIVAVLDYGVVDGAPFQVLELVEGTNTSTLLQSGITNGTPMPIEVALAIVTETAHALAYAHERRDIAGRPLGIVHRDVKPSNILVSRSGDIKLGDFGIAFARERVAVTTGIVVRGTAGYMSPEQLLGVTIGPESDIFALGVTLDQLLGDALDLEAAHRLLLSGHELPISPDIPIDVREIVVRATRVRPDERYPSARAMARALGEVLAPRLETDPKTHITQWLAELEIPRAPVARVVPSMIVAAGPPHQFVISTTELLVPPQEAAPQVVVLRPPSPPRDVARPRTSRGIIFAVALLAPLALAGVVLVVVFSSRRAGPTPPPPETTNTAVTPSALVEPPPAPMLVPTEPPEPSAVMAAPKEKESIDLLVRSLAPRERGNEASFQLLDANPEEQRRLLTRIEERVRPCVVGERVRRGATLVLRFTVDERGGATNVTASNLCHGSFCRAVPATTQWIPAGAIACVRPRVEGLQIRPPKPSHDDLFFYFDLR